MAKKKVYVAKKKVQASKSDRLTLFLAILALAVIIISLLVNMSLDYDTTQEETPIIGAATNKGEVTLQIMPRPQEVSNED